MDIPKDFRGFAGEPRSEMEVVFLFGLLYDYLDLPFVVTAVSDSFPDCEGVDPNTGKPVNIGFEFLSRHYLEHGHPVDGCDYIVCWKDDWPESPIPVISLRDLIRDKGLTDKRFIHVPIPGELQKVLDDLKEKNPQVYAAVKHFREVSLKRVLERYPQTEIAEDRTRHWGITYYGRGGLVGFYPNGRIVCGSVDEIVKRYGESVNGKMSQSHVVDTEFVEVHRPQSLAREHIEKVFGILSYEEGGSGLLRKLGEEGCPG